MFTILLNQKHSLVTNDVCQGCLHIHFWDVQLSWSNSIFGCFFKIKLSNNVPCGSHTRKDRRMLQYK